MAKSSKYKHTGQGRSRIKGAAARKRTIALKPKSKATDRLRSRPSPAKAQPARDDEEAFVETLVASGQAARLDEDGKLPAGATHKIVEDEEGHVKVVRRRFSIT